MKKIELTGKEYALIAAGIFIAIFIKIILLAIGIITIIYLMKKQGEKK